MNRGRHALISAVMTVALGLGLGATAGCTDLGIGRTCLNPTDAGVKGTQVSSPALECPTRLCLLQEPSDVTVPSHQTCTARCTTDSDCANALTNTDPQAGQCTSNFVCAIAAVAGPFACQTLCVCKDDLVAGMNSDVDGGVQCPVSCQGTATTGVCAPPVSQ